MQRRAPLTQFSLMHGYLPLTFLPAPIEDNHDTALQADDELSQRFHCTAIVGCLLLLLSGLMLFTQGDRVVTHLEDQTTGIAAEMGMIPR